MSSDDESTYKKLVNVKIVSLLMVTMLLIQGCKYWTIKLPSDDAFELPRVNKTDIDIALKFNNFKFWHQRSSCKLNWSE